MSHFAPRGFVVNQVFSDSDYDKNAGVFHRFSSVFYSISTFYRFWMGTSWIFDPKFGWKDFLKGVSSDLVIAFLAAVAGALAYGIVAAAMSAAVVALAAGVFVGIVVGGLLAVMNMDHTLTDAVIDSTVDAYEYMSSETGAYYREAKKSARGFYYYLFDNDSGKCTVQKAEPKVAEELRSRMHRITNHPKVPHQAL